MGGWGGGQQAGPRAREAATPSALQPQGAGCSGPGCLEELVLAANWILHFWPQVRGLGPSGAGRATRVSAQPSSAGQARGGRHGGGTQGRVARGGARLGMGVEKQETAGRPPAPRLATQVWGPLLACTGTASAHSRLPDLGASGGWGGAGEAAGTPAPPAAPPAPLADPGGSRCSGARHWRGWAEGSTGPGGGRAGLMAALATTWLDSEPPCWTVMRQGDLGLLLSGAAGRSRAGPAIWVQAASSRPAGAHLVPAQNGPGLRRLAVPTVPSRSRQGWGSTPTLSLPLLGRPRERPVSLKFHSTWQQSQTWNQSPHLQARRESWEARGWLH